MIREQFRIIAAIIIRIAVQCIEENPIAESLFTNRQDEPQNTPAKIIRIAYILFFIVPPEE